MIAARDQCYSEWGYRPGKGAHSADTSRDVDHATVSPTDADALSLR